MKHRKWMTIVLFAAILLTLCACGTSQTPSADETPAIDYTGSFQAEDGSALTIEAGEDGSYAVVIEITRLTSITDGVGEIASDHMAFTATDANGEPIGGTITMDGDSATVTFTDSTWPNLPNGTAFTFTRA